MPNAPTPNDNEQDKSSKAKAKRSAADLSKGRRGPTKSKTLTASEFASVKPFLNISDDRIEAARLSMVEGKTLAAIAEQFGWKSRQSVGRAITQVWEKWELVQESQKAAQQAKKSPAGKQKGNA